MPLTETERAYLTLYWTVWMAGVELWWERWGGVQRAANGAAALYPGIRCVSHHPAAAIVPHQTAVKRTPTARNDAISRSAHRLFSRS